MLLNLMFIDSQFYIISYPFKFLYYELKKKNYTGLYHITWMPYIAGHKFLCPPPFSHSIILGEYSLRGPALLFGQKRRFDIGKLDFWPRQSWTTQISPHPERCILSSLFIPTSSSGWASWKNGDCGQGDLMAGLCW